MSLDGSAQRPQVHAVGPDSDGPPPPARAEGEYLVETIDQPGPLLFPNEPFELRPIRCKLRLPQPMLEKLECLLANFGIHRDGLKSIASLSQCIHGCPPRHYRMSTGYETMYTSICSKRSNKTDFN